MTQPPRLEQLRRAADARAAALAGRYTDALRSGEGAAAERVIDDALSAGMAPEAVQSRVIAPAMVQIGDMWETAVISVADEHLASALSHRALLRLFEVISARRVRPRSRERVLLAAVQGQQHVLGLRMIADVLEGAGFDVLYLGADVPVDSLRASVLRHRPEVVGLAYGMAGDPGCLMDSLRAIDECAPETRFIVGGRAVPAALQTAGGPYVKDSLEVVGVVDALLAAPPRPLPAVVQTRGTEAGATSTTEVAYERDVVAASLEQAAEYAARTAREHVSRAQTYRELSLRDPLTGLSTRRALDEELTAFERDFSADGALLMIDIDALKAVNDQQGAAAGDRLLLAVGQAITGSVRPGDFAARFGSDEFVVLVRDATTNEASEVADRMRAAVAGIPDGASVSVGVAALSTDARGALLGASTALAEAKASGRDRVVVAG